MRAGSRYGAALGFAMLLAAPAGAQSPVKPFVAGTTFYTRHGDVFAYACAAIALALVTGSFRTGSFARRSGRASK